MLPWAMPAFVAFLTWRVLYQPIGGGINLVLTNTGLYPDIVDWLGQRSTAMPAVIAASVWRGFPFWFICILAALQTIPAELYEAARVDGANAWQRFRAVTLPGIRQVVIITTLLVLDLDRELLRKCLAADAGRSVRRHHGVPGAGLFRHADAAHRRGGGGVGRDAAGPCSSSSSSPRRSCKATVASRTEQCELIRSLPGRAIIAKLAIVAAMALALVFVLFPVYWMVITSLKLPREIFRVPSLWPQVFTGQTTAS